LSYIPVTPKYSGPRARRSNEHRDR